MNPRILNRESTAPRTPTWQQIEVSGEHPAMFGDARVVQVIDGEALQSIVAEWDKDMKVPHFDGLLVDADHLSHDPAQSTEAKAWLADLEIRNGELWGLLDWTDTGAEAVRGKRWKYFSTEYAAGDLEDLGVGPDGVRRVRPRRLAGLALTNRPNNRGGRPITNRKAGDAEHNPTQEDKTTMKSIAEKLGLPAEATEEDILAAIGSLMERAGEADKLEAEAEAEEILNRHEKRVPEGGRATWKEKLIANREVAEELLKSLPERPAAPGEKRPPIFNRRDAKTPDGRHLTQGEGGDGAAASVRAAKIRNRATDIAKAQRISFNVAWDLAEAEFPEH